MKTIITLLLALPIGLFAEPGALDTGFGDGGRLALPFGSGANAIVCQEDGGILVAGGFGVVRLHQDGRLDASFGNGGLASIGRASNQTLTVNALALQPDGKIVVAVGNGVARLLATGVLDSEFGQGGFSFGHTLPNRNDSLAALELQPDGKIIAGGSSSGNGSEFLVLRLLPDGFNDPNFGDRGRAMTTFGSILAAGRAMLLRADGSIVIAGGVMWNGHLTFGLAGFTATGVLDNGFGNAGQVALPFAGSSFSQINGLAFQSDGRLIAAGTSNGTNAADFVMVRLNPNGSLDPVFGIQRTDFANGSRDIGGAVAVTPDDKILIAGSSGPSVFRRKFALARYHADGRLDESFGLVTTQFPQSDADDASELALVGDGRIILAGLTPVNGTDSCALVRYHVDDLHAVAVAIADPAAVGDTLYYNLFVENQRADGVTGVRVTDQLPSSVSFQSAFSSQGDCTNFGNLVVCDLGSLAPGGQAAVTVFASMHATAHLCDRVTVSANETNPGLTNSAVACATVDPAREKPQNLAVKAIRAPKRIMLKAARPVVTKVVTVEIQNRSPRAEQIMSLAGLVDLEVRSLSNACPDLVAELLPVSSQARLPVVLSPGARLKVYFRVTYSTDCVPDPAKSDRFETHHDYEYTARAHHAAVDDNRDTLPADDVCPRAAIGNVTTTGRVIKDPGCGGKKTFGGLGAPIATDVVVK